MRGFLFHEKYVINPYVRNICVFPYFSCTTEIRFSHVLKIAWIFDSRKIFQKPITFECLCFLILFPYYENSLFLCFGNCMDFCFRENMWETLDFGIFCLPIHFSYYQSSLSSCFGNNTTDVKTDKKNYFRCHFQANIYVKFFTKEVKLFCSWTRSNICILDPFFIEVWKYIQYRRVGNAFCDSASIAIFLWIWQLKFV